MVISYIRATARKKLAGKWAIAIGVAAVASLLGGLITGTSFLPEITMQIDNMMDLLYQLDPRLLTRVFGGFLSSSLISLAIFLVSGTIQLGYTQFLLKQHDEQETSFNDLFSQFHRFGQGFAQKFLRGLYIFLWSLLLVVPGIIKRLGYAMTPFIMTDHPELTASEAITRSKEMMDGHKWDLFVLNLTFIGWIILCLLTLNLGFLALNPYMNAAYAAFYREISNPIPHSQM